MSKLDELEAMQVAMKLVSERVRQIQEEGWTLEHDDEHIAGELANAAAMYALTPYTRWVMEEDNAMAIWPWDIMWFKPSRTDRVEDLIKAGALIMAEIQRIWRLQRAEWLEKYDDIPGYEGRYQSNSKGVISLTPWKHGGMMTVCYSRQGKPYISLTDGKGGKKWRRLDDLLKK